MYINIYLSLLPLFDLIVQLLLRSLGRQLCGYLALLLHDVVTFMTDGSWGVMCDVTVTLNP